jgi:hypothetical protein
VPLHTIKKNCGDSFFPNLTTPPPHRLTAYPGYRQALGNRLLELEPVRDEGSDVAPIELDLSLLANVKCMVEVRCVVECMVEVRCVAECMVAISPFRHFVIFSSRHLVSTSKCNHPLFTMLHELCTTHHEL